MINLSELKTYSKGKELRGFIVYYLLRKEIIIYVGKTRDLKRRMPGHKSKPFTRIAYELFKTEKTQIAREIEIIDKYDPLFNWNRGGGTNKHPKYTPEQAKQKIREYQLKNYKPIKQSTINKYKNEAIKAGLTIPKLMEPAQKLAKQSFDQATN